MDAPDEQHSALESVYAKWLDASDGQAFHPVNEAMGEALYLPAPLQATEHPPRRLHWPRLSRSPVVAGAFLLILGGCLGFAVQPLTHLVPQPRQTQVVQGAAPTLAGTTITMTRSGSGASAGIVVDVQGDVVRPGLVRLSANARVLDAIRAAGGFRHPQDGQLLNLAAPVDDGAEVVVPAPGVDRAANSPAGTPDSQQTIDPNTADAASLETIPGIGPAKAQAIIAYRQQHGRFATVNDLLNVPGIGQATLARLKPFLTISGQK